jgi:hypothetical protein
MKLFKSPPFSLGKMQNPNAINGALNFIDYSIQRRINFMLSSLILDKYLHLLFPMWLFAVLQDNYTDKDEDLEK